MNAKNDSKIAVLIGVGIFALAAFLRLYKLTHIPVFTDEAIYIRWAQVMRTEPTLRFLPLSDGKQPLFMWIAIPFLKIFSDPLFAGRVVSLMTGLGTLLGIIVLSWFLLRSIKLGLVASFIYAISPFSVFFDRMALVDSLLTFFGVWVFVFLVITVKKVRLDTAILAGFMLGGALLTKSPAIFFAVLSPTTLILHKWPKKLKEKFNRASVFVFLFTFTYLIAYGVYNVLRLGPNFHMIGLRNKDYVYPLSHIFERPLDPLLPFLDRNLEYFWILGPSVLVILILLGTFVGLKDKRREILLPIVWGIIPILAMSEFSKTMTARYIYFSVPYLFILASIPLSRDVNWFHFGNGIRSHIGKLSKFLLIIFGAHALFIDFQLLTNPSSANLPRSERSGYLEEWTSGHGIKEVAEYIRVQSSNLPAGQQIVVGTEGFFGTLPDGLQIYLNDLSQVTIIGVGVIIDKVHPSLIDSRKFGNLTYLVVNDSRFKGNAKELGLHLLASYHKAVRLDGTHEKLLFFEVTPEALRQTPKL